MDVVYIIWHSLPYPRCCIGQIMNGPMERDGSFVYNVRIQGHVFTYPAELLWGVNEAIFDRRVKEYEGHHE